MTTDESEQILQSVSDSLSSTRERELNLNQYRKAQTWKLISDLKDLAITEAISESLSKSGIGKTSPGSTVSCQEIHLLR